MLAQKAGVGVDKVDRMCIWGNHSATQVPDFVNARINSKAALEVISDRKWCEEVFVSKVQKRGAEVIAARGKSSAASAANAIIDTMRDTLLPTPDGQWCSIGVCSDRNGYGIAPGLIFSFPCRVNEKGVVEIVENVPWDPFLKERIRLSEKELLEERTCIEGLL